MLGAALVAAGASIGFALAGGRRPSSPMWGRALDIVEIVLILALVPLVTWTSGLYGWIRTIRG
ncbi:hypothetical protein ACFQ1L_26985 [Phytohabitans flavus]|uniref:hypothetical protein n=1 Tax=Phytohabitans flavus TaxID=1076124 RepID=UPI003632AA9D